MSTNSFPITEALLIGAWCESAVWGMYTVLIGVTWYLTYAKYLRTGRMEHKTSTSLVTLIWIVATAHLSLSLRRLIDFFILRPTKEKKAPEIFVTELAEPISLVGAILYFTIVWLTDMIVVWRCWVIWGRSWTIASVPILMVIATAATSYCSMILFVTGVHDDAGIDASVRWNTATYTISLATNSLVTLITALRIWMVIRKAPTASNSTSCARAALLLLIESGAFVFALQLFQFILFEISTTSNETSAGLTALHILYEVLPQVLGLMPTLIVLIVNTRMTFTDHVYGQHPSTIGGSHHRGPLVFARPYDSGVMTTIGASSFLDLPRIKTSRNLESTDIELEAPQHQKTSHDEA